MPRWSAGVRGGESGQGRAILLRFGCIVIPAKECKCNKNAKLTLLSSISHYNRSKSDASSSLPDALVPLVPMLRWSAGVRGGGIGQGRSILLRFGCIIILVKDFKCTKNEKLTLLSSIIHYNRSKSDASSSLPDAYSMLWYLWYQCSDKAPACVEETVAREEQFCFVLVVL